MQTAIIYTLLLLFTYCAHAQSKDDTLYVAAHSGLNLRTEPGSKANKLMAIPKEGMVVVLADADSAQAYAVTEFPGFQIKGFWVEVDYKGQVGFVFSGYLSGFKPFKEYTGDKEDRFFMFMNLELLYLWENFKLPTSVHFSQGYIMDTCYRHWSSPFANGITYRVRGACGESDGKKILEFDHHGLQEVYLLYLLLKNHYSGMSGKLQWDNERKGIINYDYPEGGGWGEDHIYPEGNKIIWESFGGC